VTDLPSLLVNRTPGRKTVTAGIWIASGSAHEPESRAGASHLVEHLMLRRCGGRDRFELARLVDRIGGDVDAWTSPEMTGVSVQTTLDAADEAIDLMIDAVLEPSFIAEDVELERKIALAELELLNDDPAERVEEELLRAAWGDHPLARPVIGTAAGLAKLTPESLRQHHRNMIRPGGMMVAVAGDFDPVTLGERFGRLPLSHAVELPELPPLVWHGGRRTALRNGSDQVHVRLAFPALPVSDPDAIVVSILNRILGVGTSSRLFQRLREVEGLTYDIWSSSVLRRCGGLIEVGWACTPAVYLDVWRLVDEEIRRLAVDLVSDEVDVAKEGISRGLTMDSEIPAARCAMDVSEVLERGRRFDPEQTLELIRAVTPDRVRALAADLLRPDRSASAVCGPDGLTERVA
jgi:predicted Zn-dependent peptidase